MFTLLRSPVGTAIGAWIALGVAIFPKVTATGPAHAQAHHIRVTCSVPWASMERQTAANSCINYMPDGTQTYTAHVRHRNGKPVVGATVVWSDSDSGDAYFRSSDNPCVTDAHGKCSDELVDNDPRSGEKITVTATVRGSTATGYLKFY